jgi:hypothetical protein
MNLNREVAGESLRRGVPVYCWPPVEGEGPIRVNNLFDLDAMPPGWQFRDATGHRLGDPRPVQVPPSFVPPANASPIKVATAFLAHALASNPAPVAALMAGAAKFGIKESTLRRAKKALSIKTIEREDGFYWAFAAQVEC